MSILRRRKRLPGRHLELLPEHPDWRRLSDALIERCDGLCEACGMPLPSNHNRWDRHHRRARSAVAGDNTLPNLVALHHDCHVLQPMSVHMRPSWAKDQGLIVPPWQSPASSALWLPDGRLVYLTMQGPYHVIDDGGEW